MALIDLQISQVFQVDPSTGVGFRNAFARYCLPIQPLPLVADA